MHEVRATHGSWRFNKISFEYPRFPPGAGNRCALERGSGSEREGCMAIRSPGNRDSFERFYLRQVAHSEGCGCAEHLLREARPLSPGDRLSEIVAALKGRFRGPRSND